MKITEKTVKKIAALARISLSGSEAAEFAGQLGRIIGYMDKLDKLDTSGVSPVSHAVEMSNVFRGDEPGESLTFAESLMNAPDKHGSYFKVPGIIDHES